jgi:ferredoxin
MIKKEFSMSLIRSFLYFIKEARYNPITLIHGLLYSATVTYLRVLKNLVKINSTWFRNHVIESYHAKVVPLDSASRIVTINKNIDLRNLEQVLPYKHAKDIILKNPQNIIVYECPCRGQKKDPCRPTDVCLVIGEPFADLARMFQPFRSRRIEQEEALRILKEEDERGHIHTVWFKSAMLNRFFAICNCCKCCCLGMKFMNEHNMKIIQPSGYLAVIGDDCIGCGRCKENCQFDAIEFISSSSNGNETRRCEIISDKCFGCGICEGKCERRNISLILDPEKGAPLNIERLVETGLEQA